MVVREASLSHVFALWNCSGKMHSDADIFPEKAIIIGGLIMTGVAYAAGGGAAGGAGGIASFIPLILIFGVFYFMLIRPQQKQAKQQQQFLNELKNGNKVVTKGGIHGTITGLTDSVVTLEIADNVRIKVSRASIAGPLTKEGTQAPAKIAGG